MSLLTQYSDDSVIPVPVRRTSKRKTRKRRINTRKRRTSRGSRRRTSRGSRRKTTRRSRKRTTRKRNTHKKNNKGYMEGIRDLRYNSWEDNYGRRRYKGRSRGRSPDKTKPPLRERSRSRSPERSNSPVADPSSMVQRKLERASGAVLKYTGYDPMGTQGPMLKQNPFTGEYDQPLDYNPDPNMGKGKIPTSPPTSPLVKDEYSGESGFLKGFDGSGGGSSGRPSSGSSGRPSSGSSGRPSSGSRRDDQQLLGELYGDETFRSDFDANEL